jgi:hypothetical protein
MNSLGFKVGNAVGYQIVWLCCVAGAGQQLAWLGPLAAAVFIAATLAFGGRRRDDLRLLALAITTGLLVDTAFAMTGWLRYASAWPWPEVAPVWIVALWAAFSMTLNHSMAFLRDRPGLTALLGFFGGPLAYWSAAGAFDAVDFGAPVPWVLAALALSWACALPLIFRLDRHFQRLPRKEGYA